MNGTFVQRTGNNQGYRYGKGKWKRRRDNSIKSNPPYHQKWRHNELNQRKDKNLHKPKDKCHRCSMHGQWSRNCHLPKYLTDLYQASLKKNIIETNFIHKDDF